MRFAAEQKRKLVEAALKLEPELRRLQAKEMTRGEFTFELSRAIEMIDLYHEGGIDAFE